jgi:hypothetical protein
MVLARNLTGGSAVTAITGTGEIAAAEAGTVQEITAARTRTVREIRLAVAGSVEELGIATAAGAGESEGCEYSQKGDGAEEREESGGHRFVSFSEGCFWLPSPSYGGKGCGTLPGRRKIIQDSFA